MKTARLAILTSLTITMALLNACGGGELEAPLSNHALVNTQTGEKIADFDTLSQRYKPQAGIDMSRVVRYVLEGRVQVVHAPEGLVEEMAQLRGLEPGLKISKPQPQPQPIIACRPGQTACNGQCVNLLTDRENCGTCGLTCEGTCTKGICFPRLIP